MLPKPDETASAHIHSSNSNCCQPRRKQYQSCDHCRKRRRACDAINRGIDPFNTTDASDDDDVKNKACSTCQKSGIQCTFKWLRVCPRENLPQGIKKKLNATHPIFSEATSENSTTPSLFSESDSPWPRSPSHNHPITFEWTGSPVYEHIPGQDHSMLGQPEPYRAWHPPIDALEVPVDPALGWVDQEFVHNNMMGALQSSSMVTHTIPATCFSTANTNMPIAPVYANAFEEDGITESMEAFAKLDVPMPLPSDSRRPSYAAHHRNGSGGSFDASMSGFFTEDRQSTEFASTGSHDRSNNHERHLSQSSSRSVVIAELRQIYNDSVGNSLSRQVSVEDYPIERKRSVQDDLLLDDPCAALLSAGTTGFKTVVTVTRRTEHSGLW
jgi:hypothetical protein